MAGSFLVRVFKSHFLSRCLIKQAVRTFLFEEIALGAHSSVLVYYGRITAEESAGNANRANSRVNKPIVPAVGRGWVLYRYSWAHSTTRPMTVVNPIQCCGVSRIYYSRCITR